MSRDDHVRGRIITRIRHSGNDEPAIPAEQRRRAARRVATVAVDAAECAELLDMLGLTATDGLQSG